MKNNDWFKLISVLLFIAILGAGCGSNKNSNSSSAPAQVFTLGTAIQYTTYNVKLSKVETGDLNGDGLIDVAAIGDLTGDAHLLLYYQGTNQRFSLIVDKPYPGFIFRGMAVGDINNDGLNDVVISAISKTGQAVLMILYHDPATNTLQEAIQIPLSSADIGDICIADLNGDGREDIAVLGVTAENAGRISISYQLSDGSLANEFVYTNTPVTLTGKVIAADMNGDGRNDIVVQSSPGGFSVIKQGADGSLSPTPDVYAVPKAPSSFTFAVGDINSDGKNDVVVSVPGESGSFYFYMQNAGILDVPVEFDLLQSSPDNIEIADINGDGLNDIVGVVSGPVSSQSASNELRVYYQGPQHTFSASDFSSFGFSGALLTSAESLPSVRFAETSHSTSAESVPSLAVADVTGDGLKDVIVGWSATGLLVFPGTVQSGSGSHNGPSGTFTISGTVTSDGAPLSGVSMALTGPVSKTVNTDSSGNYSFTTLGNGNYTITPSKSGYAFSPSNRSVTVNVANVTSQNFTATTYSISGTVTVNGVPLSGVSMALTGPVSKTVNTDSNGNYSFTTLGNGNYTITPSKSAYVFSPSNRSVTVSVANVTSQNFTATTYSISGTVTVNGVPLSGVSMALTGPVSKTVNTDSGGNYSFTTLGNGNYTITPSKSGYVLSPSNRSVTVSGANVTSQNFTAATYSISGTVTVNGAPLSGVSMALTGPVSKTVNTDSGGNYYFTTLGNGNYTITPSKSGYVLSPSNRSVTVSGANVTSQNFTAATYSISGTVTVNGVPLSGVSMALTGPVSKTVNTDSGGNYSFTTLGNGNYTITPSKSAYVFSPSNRSVTVSGANVTSQNFTAATYSISGTVTVNGVPLSGVSMALTGPVSKTVNTDSGGNYSFTTLGNGNYTITPSKSAYVFSPSNRSVTVSGANVTSQNFTAATYSISGTVTVNGVPLSGVSMALTGPASKTVTTDSNGNYSFTTLGNGNYTITPSKSAYVFSPSNLSVTVNGANVTSQNFTAATYSISGTVTVNGVPLSGVSMALTGPASKTVTTDSGGNYSFTTLGNGNYTITPSKSGYVFSPSNRSATVSGANVTSQNFTATTYSISGIIKTSGGSPVSSVTVTLNGTLSKSVLTNSSGVYLFTIVGNGSYTIVPGKTGYFFNPTLISVTVNGANVTSQNFTATTYSISGTVTVNGAPLSGVSMTLTGPVSKTVNTDSNGNYSFTPLGNGNYTITPSKSGYIFSPSNLSVTVNGTDVTGQNFTGN